MQTIAKWKENYKDDKGNLNETPADLLHRVAKFAASADLQYGASPEAARKRAREFYDVMASLEFLPSSPTLMNAGMENPQISSCYVQLTSRSRNIWTD